MFLHDRECVMGASPTSEPERGRIEVRLEDRFQNEFDGHLHQSVFQRWDAERPESSRLARLWYQPLANKFRLIDSAAQLLADFRKELFHPSRPLFDLSPRHPVRARRSASRVAGETLPSVAECAAITHQIEQVLEPLLEVRVTPSVQLALHVEDERSIHRVGPHQPTSCRPAVPTVSLRHVGGFPALGLLWRLRPLRQRSSVVSIIFGLSAEEVVARFPGSLNDPLSVLGADSTPCGFWALVTASSSNA